MGCDSATTVRGIRPKLFQSTHPHGVRQAELSQLHKLYRISIHAPAWGATAQAVLFELGTPISIHAPAWGATYSMLSISNTKSFQSTHPHGVRLFVDF